MWICCVTTPSNPEVVAGDWRLHNGFVASSQRGAVSDWVPYPAPWAAIYIRDVGETLLLSEGFG